jgi:hypothetical protein
MPEEVWRTLEIWGSMLFAHMKRLAYVPMAPGRVFGPWVCLVAVVMLWAPMWAVAWQTGGMACCNGNMCASHGHSKPDHPGSPQASPEGFPMNCERHGGSALPDCSMSCSRESSPPLATAVIFVLPGPAVLSQPGEDMVAPPKFVPTEFVPSFEPPSPPPRASLFSL